MSQQPQQPANNRPKDTLINIGSTKRGKSKKGQDYISLGLTTEEVSLLIDELEKAAIASDGRGVRFSVYTTVKQTNDGTRSFDSSFAFVSPKDLPPQKAEPKPPVRFVPRSNKQIG